MEDEPKKDSLEKISEALGTTFESSDLEISSTQLATVEESPKAVAVPKQEEEMYADEDYLRADLKDLISKSKKVLDTLGKDIMLGSQPRLHEVYATLLNSTVAAYKELGDLNRNMAETQVKMKKINSSGKPIASAGKDGTIPLTANQLSLMLENARKNSSMNEITVDFKVSEDDK